MTRNELNVYLAALRTCAVVCATWGVVAENAVAEKRGLGRDATETMAYNLPELAAKLRELIARAEGGAE